MTFVAIFILAATGVVAWYLNRDYLNQLREKDTYRYEKILHQLRELRWSDAWRQFQRLRAEGYREAFRDQYRRWKEKWNSDPAFRQKILQTRIEERKTLAAQRRMEYEETVEEILASRTPRGMGDRDRWERSTPWQKGLTLRGLCRRYVELEIRDFRNRVWSGPFPNQAVLLDLPGVDNNMTPAEYCENLVPVSDSPEAVKHALQNLKEGINYYYFVRLLNELGLRDSELFTYSGRLYRMTGDMDGS